MRVTLNGFVLSDDDAWVYKYFGYDVICPGDVRQALADNPEGETLTLEINSPGGSVFAGFEIYTVLRNAAGVNTEAEVQSLAASAASTLMLGCSRVLLSPVAQVMIHDPMTSTDGNIQDHQESLQALTSIRESILNAYEVKCRGRRTREELRGMMKRSTWMSAQAAVEAGLADGILWQEDSTPIPANIVNAVGGGIRAIANSGGLPDVEELRARYQALQGQAPSGEGPDPAPDNPDPQASTGGSPDAHTAQDWQAQARLDLEKNRFMEVHRK